MTEHEKRIREALEETQWGTAFVGKADLRALLADLDAVRGALEAATTELESHQGNPYCNLDDLPEFKAAIAQARAALKGATA